MEITLIRTDKTESETRGVLGIDNKVIGYTIEHPVVAVMNADKTPAIKEGEYKLRVRINPSSGTPTIKVAAKFIPTNIAIRCSLPMGNSNSSIVLVSTPNSNGETKLVDYQPWLSLLDLIGKHEEVTLRIM